MCIWRMSLRRKKSAIISCLILLWRSFKFCICWCITKTMKRRAEIVVKANPTHTLDVASSGSAVTLNLWLSPLALSPWCNTLYKASRGTQASIASGGMSSGTGGGDALGGSAEGSSGISGLKTCKKKAIILCYSLQIIRIFQGCEVRIEKSVRGSLFEPQDAKQWSRGTDFSHQTTMIDSFSCIPFDLHCSNLKQDCH